MLEVFQPLIEKLFVGLVVRLGIAIGGIPGRILKVGPSLIEYYASRTLFNERAGGLTKELKRLDRIWFLGTTGQFIVTQNLLSDPVVKRKFDRIVILDPEGEYLKIHVEATAYDGRENVLDELKGSIRTLRTQGNAQVKFTSWPVMGSMIVANPPASLSDLTEPDSYIRLEVGIPYDKPAEWPNFIIKRKGEPKLYGALYEHYIRMWCNAH